MALIDVLKQLQTCLCTELEATPGGSPCFCCIIHAPAAPPAPDGPLSELCKCGLAWVRLVDLTPRVAQRQQPRLASGVICSPKTNTIVTIELGILRCTGISDEIKASDVCTCLGRHAAAAAADAEALIRAAVCCPAGGTFERVTPIGSDDCTGSALRLVIELPQTTGSPGESP